MHLSYDHRMQKQGLTKLSFLFKTCFLTIVFASSFSSHAQLSQKSDSIADSAAGPRQPSDAVLATQDSGRGAQRSAAPDAKPTQQSIDEINRTTNSARSPAKPEAPNQFQLFVQEATGKLLPHFGASLFESAQSYLPDASLAAPASYVLGPGDEIRLQVWGSMDVNLQLVIDRNGQVQIPKVGVVSLTGVTLVDLVPTLRAQLSKAITNFNLNASLGRLRSIQVYVVGQARQPGTYVVSSLSTMVNALFASGGPNANGSMRAIELRRDGKLVTQIDLYDFISKGDKSRDVALLPGDVIFIPQAGPRVAVLGAFDQIGIFETKGSGESVREVLAYGGGVTPVATVRKALLERVNPTVKSAREVLDLALDANGLTQKLQGGDILTLLPVSPAFANAVTLQGLVAEPVRHRWFAGMRILDLIPNSEALVTPDYFKRRNALARTEPLPRIEPLYRTEPSARIGSRAPMESTFSGELSGTGNPSSTSKSQPQQPRSENSAAYAPAMSDRENGMSSEPGEQGKSKLLDRLRGMSEQINWDYAVVERLNTDRLTTELLPFNLGRAVLQRDASQNLLLQPGDVVTILGRNELALPQERQTRLVRVEGEVAAPGIYQAMPGETMGQLLRRIGGLTPQAYVYGTEFSRESIRKRQQSNLEVLIRRLEAQAQSNGQNLGSNSAGKADAAQVQFAVAQQQAQLKSQIERLRALKSNGRMSLELETRALALADLPELALEDGDQISVPPVPSYVAAFGAVNNENVFIFKPGKTVADIVKSAGLADDADADQLFLLRADGSVLSRGDNNSLFGRPFASIAVLPGDTLVVPTKLDRETGYNATVRGLKDWTQILSNLGLGLAAIKTLKN